MEVNVISSDKDGAELRREKRKNPYHTVCNGSGDDGNINEALRAGNKLYSLPDGAWDRIFNGTRNT